MKKTIKLALAASMVLGSTSAFATNGSALIGTGAKARGMGGTDIGVAHGAESALSNPALITSVDGSEVQFGGTLFMPNVAFDNGTGAGSKDSAADMSMIPSVSLASKVNESFYWGVGMWGTAGMGVDYRDEAANFKMVTNLQLMQFGVPLTYATHSFSVGVTPVLQYGALDINYDAGAGSTGAGIAQDLAFGVNVGAAYAIAGVTVGASYKSQIDMEYKGQLTAAMAGFGVPYENDTLSTPAEVGVGVSYAIAGSTVALDFKQIKWSDAEGYKDFGWNDQNVIALGYEYATEAWAARVGYNYAKSPIEDQGLAGSLNNTLNLLGFPAIVESHVTLGGTYAFNEKTSLDLAYVYALEANETYEVSNFPNPGTREIETTHSQSSISAQLNYNF